MGTDSCGWRALSNFSFCLLIIDLVTDWFWIRNQVERKSFDEQTIIELVWFFCTVTGTIVGVLIFLCGLYHCWYCCCSDGRKSSSSQWSSVEQVLNFILTVVDVSLLCLSLYILYGTNLTCRDEKEDSDKIATCVSVSATLVVSSAMSLVAIIVRAIKPCVRALILCCNMYGDEAHCCCLCLFYAVAIILGFVTTFLCVLDLLNCLKK